MAPLPIIDGAHRVAFSWRIGSSGPTAANVMHFHGASVDPDGLHTALVANITAGMWLTTFSGASIYQMTITPLDGAAATKVYAASGGNMTGQASGPDYIPAVASVISLRTNLRGRRNRGRIFLPFVSEAVASNGAYTLPVTAWQTTWNTFMAAMNTSLWPLHVASYGHSLHRTKTPGGGYTLTPVSWPPTSNAVTQLVVESTFGTMRRRQSRLR